MTASGVKWSERMMRLARYTAPFRHRPKRRIPAVERPVGPKLEVGRGRPRPRRESWTHIAGIVFWTLVVLAGWYVYSWVVWGALG